MSTPAPTKTDVLKTIDDLLKDMNTIRNVTEQYIHSLQSSTLPRNSSNSDDERKTESTSIDDLMQTLVQTLSQTDTSKPTHDTVQILTDLLSILNQSIQMLESKQEKQKEGSTEPSATTPERSPEFFFPKDIASRVQFDCQAALNYVTPYHDAFEIGVLLLQKVKQVTNSFPHDIIEGTGGLGGNMIGFIRSVGRLYDDSEKRDTKFTMIELDTARCKCGENNVRLIEERIRKINKCEVLNKNFLNWWRDLKKSELREAVIFFDPPWGNADYSKHQVIYDLYLMQENGISKSVKELAGEMLAESNVSCVCLKVPYNFSEESLASKFHVEYILMKKIKYVMIFNKH